LVATIEQPPIVISENLRRLIQTQQQEVLWEGPAGTGKTFGLALYVRLLCEMYPGTLGLIIRQTRKSLNSSFIDIFENEVLGHGHPALTPPRKRNHRDEYIFPYAETVVDGRPYKGSSQVDLVGMDSPERIMSTQYDWGFFIEATEGFQHAWDLIGSRLRRFYIHRFGRPWSLQVADVNPAHAGHWLNVRANEPYTPDPELISILNYSPEEIEGWMNMHRIKTTLKDNPKYWDARLKRWTAEGAMYGMTLDRMSPVNQKRLRDGLWVSESGQVYAGFKHERHVVNGRLVKRKEDYGRWRLEPVTGKIWAGSSAGLPEDFSARLVAYFVIAVDWGFSPDPASVGLYAVDDDGHAFRVKCYYQTNIGLDEWAKRIVDWQHEYDVRAIVCDHPPEKVAKLNDMLGHKLNHLGHPIAMVAKKGPGSILAGIETVRWALKDSNHGEPRIRFFANALENDPDQELIDARVPSNPLNEFDGYIFPQRVETGKNKELPIDRDNHFMDELRYFSDYNWSNTHRAPQPPRDPRELHPLFIRGDPAEENRIALEAAGLAETPRFRRR